MNGSKESITELAKILTTGPLDPNVEVIVGCPAIYISFARGVLPASIHVAGQVCSCAGFCTSLQPLFLSELLQSQVGRFHRRNRPIHAEGCRC